MSDEPQEEPGSPTVDADAVSAAPEEKRSAEAAEEAPARRRPGRRSIWREYLEALCIAVIFASFAKGFVVQAFKIPSASMEDNLLIGDHILVNKFIYAPTWSAGEKALLPKRDLRRGDVVVFKYPLDPERDFIKRCVGLPGDTVEVIDKKLWINGRPIDESGYAHFKDPQVYRLRRGLPEELRSRDSFGPYTVPEGQLFCMGDNRDVSDDSRRWGTVPVDYVKGRALMIYWSFEAQPEGDDGEWPGIWRTAVRLAGVAKDFFTRTRWSRTFRLVR